MTKTKNIGLKVDAPNKECTDKNCPFHGNVKVRGQTFRGIVVSSKMNKSAVVGWERYAYLTKYDRKEKKKSRVAVHNPECIDAKEGDVVKIAECRPLSKTKNFIIIEKEGIEKEFLRKEFEKKEEKKETPVIKKNQTEENKEASQE